MPISSETVSPDEVSAFQEAFQNWNAGNQSLAIDRIRPHAESGRVWAMALLSWLLMQQGAGGLGESARWAVRAAHAGHPWQTWQVFNNLLGNLPSSPDLAGDLEGLLAVMPSVTGIDIVGQAWNAQAQGQPALAMKLLNYVVPPTPETIDPRLQFLSDRAGGALTEIERSRENIRVLAAEVDAISEEARQQIARASDDLKTSAGQAKLLVTTVSSDATNSLFKADAQRNARESKGAWITGLAVLASAALVAILPVILHYLQIGYKYSGIEQLGIHLVSTAALASFAGVLLARARSRDQAAQRANDLSTAMGTMISYSNQISDPVEKQRFMMMMGQVVLQSHLASNSNSKATSDDSLSGMLALASLIKPAAGQGANAAS